LRKTDWPDAWLGIRLSFGSQRSLPGDEAIELGLKIKNPASDLHEPRPLLLKRPHLKCLRGMSQISSRIVAAHPSIGQHADPNLFDGVDKIHFSLCDTDLGEKSLSDPCHVNQKLRYRCRRQIEIERDMPRAPQDRRPRGRPTLPSDEAKRHSLGIRTTKKIKDALQRAAELSGRSVAQEIEFRIEQSFDVEKAYGGPETQKVLRTLAGVTRDDEWTRSWFGRRAVFADWQRRLFEESPSRLAYDLMYYADKYGIVQARELAIRYYDHVVRNFSERDQQEYFDWVKKIVGLSPEDLIAPPHPRPQGQ
jgi:hypothetical protein